MGVNFISHFMILLRTMEDPDVITRAQLALSQFASGKIAAQENTQKGTADDRARGGNIRIYLYDGSYAQHILQPYSRARYYTEFSGPSPTWENMQKTCSTVIRMISPGYYVPTSRCTNFLYS